MSEENIPEKVDPFRFADNAIRLQGALPIKDLQRLSESLHDNTGSVAVNLEFGKNEQGVRFLKGQLNARLQLQCQRCMREFGYEMTNSIWLAIVHSEEEAEQLPEGYDSVVVNGDILVIPDVIEDELIVNLPVVPMHNPKECNVKLPLEIGVGSEAENEKESPFKVIEFLRAKQDLKK